MVVASVALRGVRLVPIDHGLPEDDATDLLRGLDHEGLLGLRDAPEAELRWGVQRVHGVPRALGAIASILSNDPTLTHRRLVADDLLFEGEVLENLVAEQYRRLTAPQRVVVEALAIFGHPVPEVAVRYLLAPFDAQLDIRAVLSVLVRAMTVRFDRETDAYDLHPLDQAYAYARIPLTGELYTRDSLHRRAANYFELLPTPAHAKDVADVEPSLKARAHYFRIGEFNRAGELASVSTRVLLRCGHYSTVERILDESLETARGATLASAHLGKASIAGLRNDWSGAIQHNRKAIEILQPLPHERDRRLLGIATSNMAYAYCRLPDFARAEEACREGLDLAAELSDEWLEGKITGLLALASLLTGNYDRVVELTLRCLELHERHPLVEAGTSPAHALDILGMAHVARAEFDQALARFEQSLDLRETLHSKFGLGHSYHNVALVYHALGDLDRAMHELERSLAIREEIRHLEGLSETFCTMAMVHQAAGRAAMALDCALRSLAFATERGGGAVSTVRARLTLGFVLLQLHRLPDALKELDDTREVSQRVGLLPELARSSYYLALLRRESGDFAEASRLALEAAGLSKRALPALSSACQQLADALLRERTL
jgi:tetratricopeptide (TPR) repeat protein